MAGPDLRRAALQLVHQSPDHLSRRFRRRIFPVDLPDAAIGNREPISAASNGLCSRFSCFGLGIFLPALRIVPYLMFGGTLCVALSYMVRARIEPKFDTVAARLLVMFLAFVQPLVRGWSRISPGCISNGRRAASSRRTRKCLRARRDRGNLRGRVFWSEEGGERHHLLEVDLRSCWRKKAGATRPTPAGRNGTFRSTATFGGASSCRP